jgi:cobalamin biosynthesis Mg chelatase CobN
MSEELTIERLALAVKEDNSNSNGQTEVQTQGPSEPSTTTTTTTATVAVVEQTTEVQAPQQPNVNEGVTAQTETTAVQTPQVAVANVVPTATPQTVAVSNSVNTGGTPYSTSTAIPGQYVQPPLTQPLFPFSVNMNVQQARPAGNPFIQFTNIFTKARAAASSIAQQVTSQEARPLWVAGIIGLLGALGIFFSTQQPRKKKEEEV